MAMPYSDAPTINQYPTTSQGWANLVQNPYGQQVLNYNAQQDPRGFQQAIAQTFAPAPPVMDFSKLLGLMGGGGSGAARGDAARAQARIGLQRQGLAIDRAGINRELGLLPREHSMALAELLQQIGGAKYQGERSQQEQSGEAAARGAVATTGNLRRMTDIRRSMADQLATLGRRQTDENLTYKKNLSDLRDQLKRLGLRGKELDLQSKDIAASLSRGLAKSGLSQFMSVNDLMGGLVAGKQQNIQQLGGLVSYLMSVGGAGGR